MTVQQYAVIATVAGEYFGVSVTIGQVVNRIICDVVTEWALPPA